MDAIATTLAVLGSLLFIFALVNVIYPIKALGVPTRKRALALLGGAFVLSILSAVMETGEQPELETPNDAAVNEAPDNSPEDGTATDRQVVAEWRSDLTPDTTEHSTLVYQDGAMLWESRYSGGSSWSQSQTVVERPADAPNYRRFDLRPDDEQSGYITLSKSGSVGIYAWEGTLMGTPTTTFIAPDAMAIGVNPVVRECVPKQLSVAAKETVRLYSELLSFKDSPEFRQRGFAVGGPYNGWLESIKRVQHGNRDDALAAMLELGFPPGDVMMLGLEYVRMANGRADSDFRVDTERKIRTGLRLATCDEY